MVASASQMMRPARARWRAGRLSSTRLRTAETAVTAAKKPTTIHAQASYAGGKLVSDTVTTETTTSAARNRTSHWPCRLGHIALLSREVLRRDLGVQLEP